MEKRSKGGVLGTPVFRGQGEEEGRNVTENNSREVEDPKRVTSLRGQGKILSQQGGSDIKRCL